jgi:hypothetical protein
MEIDNAGFHIYRSTGGVEIPHRINAVMIPSQGTAHTGQHYTYVDDHIVSGAFYYYILEDVSTQGIRTWHGPANRGQALEKLQPAAE